MDFNKRWRRELQFNVVMLGLSSLACVLTALVRDPLGLSHERPLRVSQQFQTADAGSATVSQFGRQPPR
ncbi:MAG: hypothetical protein JWP89_1396 [Schlesneria sp.]|nr:hypothetical protein [Schlesneria sp.]